MAIPFGGLKNLIVRAVTGGKLILIKNGPRLMVYGGCAGVVVSIYQFCKATADLDEERYRHRRAMEELATTPIEFDHKEHSRTVFYEKRNHALRVAKKYAAPTTMAAGSLLLILGGFNKIDKRLGMMSVLYKGLEDSFNHYRQNVRDDLGDEKDREYLHGLKHQTVNATIMNEDGTTEETKAEVLMPESKRSWSIYSRFFDEYSSKWTNNSQYNVMFLQSQESYADDILYTRRYLFLSEVFEALGLPDCEMAHIVGWHLTEEEFREHKKHVSFRIMDLNSLTESKRLFINGYEPSILLDFNVDGVIWDKVFPKHK